MPDVLGYLRSKGLPIKPAGAKNIHTACVFCGEDPASRGRLYINVDEGAEIPGLYFCHLCNERGSLATLKRFFGDEVSEDEGDSAIRAEIMAVAAAYYIEQLERTPAALRYLTGPSRGLSEETVANAKLGYAPMDFGGDVGGQSPHRPKSLFTTLLADFEVKDILATGLCQEYGGEILDSLYGMITIPYQVAGNVVSIRGRTWPLTEADWDGWTGMRYQPAKGKYKSLPGSSTRLFNSDVAWDADELILTEGEFDALALSQHGFPAVGVPGANSWQESWDGYLERAKRVWLLFDRDETGEKAARKLSERIGPKARRVFISEEGTKVDPSDWFGTAGHTAEEFEDLLDAARRGGLLVTVREAISEFNSVQGTPGLKFAWPELDAQIAPGLHRGQLFMLLAKSGTGKTLWLLNMAHRARMVPGQEDLKILFLSLEQTRGEWWDRARRIHRFFNIDSSQEEAELFWRNNLLMVDRNRLSEADVRQVLEDFAYQMGKAPDLVLLDYVGYFARGFRGEAYERTSQAVMAVKGLAKEYRVPILAPHQVSRSGKDGEEFTADSARDSGVIEETADFLLTMWNPDNALGKAEAEKQGQVFFRIAKSRHGGRGAPLGMQLSPVSLAMVPLHVGGDLSGVRSLDPLGGRARQELIWRRSGVTSWPVIVRRHRLGIEGDEHEEDLEEW